MRCQACDGPTENVLSLGYMPPVNDFVPVGAEPKEQLWMPTDLHYCPACELVQLGFVADPKIVFPPSYPYTSGTTKMLRDNFANLALQCWGMGLFVNAPESKRSLVVDIGSNDGTLLENFRRQGCRVLGIEPTDVSGAASARGIETWQKFFSRDVASSVKAKFGPADIVTCANCFAHMPDVHGVIDGVLEMLAPNGVFVTESTYLIDTLEKLQYDTIYHEHLRYYSVDSLTRLLKTHGLQVFRATHIPSHGGSIRVYAKRSEAFSDYHYSGIALEPTGEKMRRALVRFAAEVNASRFVLLTRISDVLAHGGRIFGIGAPSRASTVINYCRLDASMIDCVCEVPGSLKLGKYMPGTAIPVVDESRLFTDQPSHAILFSWHIADDLIPKLREKGFRGEFILPCAKVIEPWREAAQ